MSVVPPATGFYGKIPSRGDFVRAGLPVSFVNAWDAWLQRVLPAARAALADDWNDCWMEAPVWRFSLPPGQCGPERAVGLWMPSVDSAGRHFPLALAMVMPGEAAPEEEASQTWLDEAEQAGRDALETDLSPAELCDRLPAPPALRTSPDSDVGRWWSDGSPRVRAISFLLPALPGSERFALMLCDQQTSGQTEPLTPAEDAT